MTPYAPVLYTTELDDNGEAGPGYVEYGAPVDAELCAHARDQQDLDRYGCGRGQCSALALYEWTDDVGQTHTFCLLHHPDTAETQHRAELHKLAERKAYHRALDIADGLSWASDEQIAAEYKRRGLR